MSADAKGRPFLRPCWVCKSRRGFGSGQIALLSSAEAQLAAVWMSPADVPALRAREVRS